MLKSLWEFTRDGAWIILVFICILSIISYIFLFKLYNNIDNTNLENKNRDEQSNPVNTLSEAHAETLSIGVSSIDKEDIISKNVQLSPTAAPGNIILPKTFNGVYDYYMINPDFYFCDGKGNIHKMDSIGMAVKLCSPVKVVLYSDSSNGSAKIKD